VKFAAFNAIGMPDQGGVLLLATLTNHVQGIWRGDSTADLQLVTATGATVNGKTIASLSFLAAPPYVNGQTHGFDQATGNLVYRATFADHTSAIVQLTGDTTNVPVVSGSAAPGVTGATFATLGNPILNGTGDIAFQATLTGLPASERTGIWADDNTGTLQLVAQTGGAAPGTSGVFATLSDPVYNDNEAVAFRGALRAAAGQATAATATGIWATTSGTLALVARQGAQAPGCPPGATFATFTSLTISDQGGAIFLATLNPRAAAGVTAANKTGVWAIDQSGNLQIIARTGDIFDGDTITGITFMPVLPYVDGQGRNFELETGILVYQATLAAHESEILEVIFP
jgi:hypothetical protein